MFEFKLSDNLLVDYLADSREQLTMIESELVAMEGDGAEIDEERVNRVFRAVHSIKGASNFFDLAKIGELGHQTENVLGLIRSRRLTPTPECVRTLLEATDGLREMIDSPDTSAQADNSDVMAKLTKLYEDHRTPIKLGVPAEDGKGPMSGALRMLLVEDDFACRLLLQTFLSRYGQCHIAVNGREAVEAFSSAQDLGLDYDLICMDIMMPEMDGREAVRRIRELEEAKGVRSTYGTRIFMVTTMDEVKEVILCFKELCDAYLMKPIDLGELRDHMRSYGLIQ
jgi:two-component system chemotaxis response regulator CheY